MELWSAQTEGAGLSVADNRKIVHQVQGTSVIHKALCAFGCHATVISTEVKSPGK